MSQNNTKKTILVNSAKTIFMEKGFSKTTVDEICTLAGVAKGTFFYYFETKQHIILDMINKYVNEVKNEFCRNLSYASTTLEKLDLTLDVVFCSKNTSIINFAFDTIESLNWVEKQIHESKLEMLTPILFDIISEGKKNGVFNVEDIEITSSVLLNGLNAYYLTRKNAFSDPKLCKNIYKGIDEIVNKVLAIDLQLVS